VKILKIKLNNIFKNVHIKKDITNINRRRKSQNIDQIREGENKHIEKSSEYRRKGAVNNKNVFNVLKIFKTRFAVKRSYYILFVFMVILATISVYTTIATYRKVNNESFAVFSNNDEKSQPESSIAENLQDLDSNNIDTRNSTNNQTPVINTNKEVVATTITSTNIKKTTPTIEPLNFVTPLKGEVIKIYSVDKLLFSKTLESWKTHDGVDIRADLGTNIKSIEKGIVEKIYEDSFLGYTIIIDHGQGYKSIYSNLASDVNVKEKQIIKKSAILGKVGKTSIGEIKDESHIHFMLMFNNKVIDPASKIKF
jgi:murein DD-endopeptidase MepM/ murein hydrolase activator NlpD